ncbi:MADS-box protein SOC1 [Glycine soja]
MILSTRVTAGWTWDDHNYYPDDQHCSHRIAKVLDPDGKIPPAQISNMLKRLGLVVAPRRKMCDADAEGPLARKPKDLFMMQVVTDFKLIFKCHIVAMQFSSLSIPHLKQEAANMMKKIGLLEAAKRARKIQVFKEQIKQLKEKEKVLLDENAKLTENGRLSEKVKLLLFGINSVWPIVHLDNILKQIEAVPNYQGDNYMGKPVRINCHKAILMMKCSALFSRPLSTSPNQLDDDKITGATNHKSVNLEGSLLVQHLFKDHRRCSYMIANALDKDGKFTTAQVSQKLKQLGLYLPLPKDGKFTTAQGVLLLN